MPVRTPFLSGSLAVLNIVLRRSRATASLSQAERDISLFRLFFRLPSSAFLPVRSDYQCSSHHQCRGSIPRRSSLGRAGPGPPLFPGYGCRQARSAPAPTPWPRSPLPGRYVYEILQSRWVEVGRYPARPESSRTAHLGRCTAPRNTHPPEPRDPSIPTRRPVGMTTDIRSELV